MKKFITVSPLQNETGLKKTVYYSEENQLLQYNNETMFPIIPVISGYVKKDECIQLLIIVTEYENSQKNKFKIIEEVQKLSESIGFTYEYKEINCKYSDSINSNLELFKDILKYLDNDDRLYACISYGTKPMPIIEMMALNYAYRSKDNVSIECIVYGKTDFESKKSYINDVTALFYMDEIVNNLAQMKAKNPEQKIKKILDL